MRIDRKWSPRSDWLWVFAIHLFVVGSAVVWTALILRLFTWALEH